MGRFKHIFPRYFLFILMIIGMSCGKTKTEIPPGVLSQQEMIPVLVDIHIAQAATGLYSAGDSIHFTMNDYIPQILALHHIDKSMYERSISFYTLHPEIMQEMYDEVINELSKKEGEAKSK